MLYLSFSFWLTSLSMVIPRSIHIAPNGTITFFSWLSNIQKNKMDNKQGPTVQHNVTWQTGWEGCLQENGYMYMYG